MTFGTELQQPASHRALLQLQDAEIQLLELMKKCVQQKIKSDREYANSLMVIVNHAQKVDLGGTSTPLFQVWGNIVKETEGIISMLRDNAEQLSTKSMDRLVHVISEKKTARKFYNDERLRLDSEFSKLKDDVTRLRQEYERSVNKQIQERLKFEELRNRGVTGRKLEDAKGKLQKASLKLHKVNNDYVSTLLEAKLYQTNMLEITLPGILNYQQEIQQTLVEQCKSVLEEYATLTDLSAPEYSKHYQTINETIGTINPITEYVNFVKDSKSDPVQPLKIEFDDDLLVGYKGTLRNNTIALDNLTVEHVQHSQSRITDLLNECQQKLTNKSSSLGTQKKQLEKLPGESRLLEMQRNSICVHKRAVLDLEREIKELQGRESILKSLQSLYTDQLAKLGDKELPPGVDLGDDSTEPTPPRDQHSDETSNRPGGHFQNLTEKLTSVFGKNKKSTPPIVPAKDFHTEGTDSYIDAEPPRPPASNHVTPRWSESENHDTPGSNRITQSPSESYQPVSFDEEVQPLFQMNPNPTIKLDEEEWMHGVLPREEVQRLLTTNGDYLVRESKNRKTGETQYVLSVFWDDHKHFIIQGTEGNWRFEGDQYPSVQELIINQHNSGVPVTRKSGAILKRPIKRETWELRNDDLILGQKIGNGNFGDVFKGTYKPQKLEVAIKTCRETLSEDAKKKFLQEGRILKQYDHPNIVRFIGIGAQRHPVMIVMEYVSGGALLTFLKKQGSHQTKKQLVKMCDDAAAGMAYLEERSCIHRDLAARNCLVGKHNIVKISDFGMSREEEEYTVSGGLKQIPIKWTAPEALNFGTYTTACDVWSFGVLMWEVFSFGQSPYPGLTNTQARERVDEGYRMPSPEGTPSVVHDLMLRCWAYEAKDRPSFKDIHCDLQKIHKDLPVR